MYMAVMSFLQENLQVCSKKWCELLDLDEYN